MIHWHHSFVLHWKYVIIVLSLQCKQASDACENASAAEKTQKRCDKKMEIWAAHVQLAASDLDDVPYLPAGADAMHGQLTALPAATACRLFGKLVRIAPGFMISCSSDVLVGDAAAKFVGQ